MIDLETLGTDTDCIVLSIGAVAFDPCGKDTWDGIRQKHPEREFYMRLDITEQHCSTRTMEPNTIEWWMRQGQAAKNVFREKPTRMDSFFNDFNVWARHYCPGGFLWGNGPAFDNAILRSLFKAFGRDFPFRYYNDNCYRTVRRMGGASTPEKPNGMVAHNALDDALYQALNVQHWMRELGFEGGDL